LHKFHHTCTSALHTMINDSQLDIHIRVGTAITPGPPPPLDHLEKSKVIPRSSNLCTQPLKQDEVQCNRPK
jgi:hypothetical protein